MTHEDKIELFRGRGQTAIADKMQAQLDEIRRKERQSAQITEHAKAMKAYVSVR